MTDRSLFRRIAAALLGLVLGSSAAPAIAQAVRTVDAVDEHMHVGPQMGRVNDEFGSAIDADGPWLAIGAPSLWCSEDPQPGSVTVYLRNGDQWMEFDRIDGPVAPPSIRTGFGTSIDIDGSTMAIGHLFGPVDGVAVGTVEIREWNGQSWAQTATITPPAPDPDAPWGYRIRLQDDLLVVACPTYDFDGPDNGKIDVFVRTPDGDWVHRQTLTAPGRPASPALFAATIGLDGDTLAVGAPWLTPTPERPARGAVYTFTWTGDDFVLDAELASPSAPGTLVDGLGDDVAIHGDVLVVTERTYASQPERFHVFHRSPGGRWDAAETFDRPVGRPYASGWMRVATDGDRIVVGDLNASLDGGLVHVYERQSDLWTHRSSKGSGRTWPDVGYGFTVAIAGEEVLIGAEREIRDAGWWSIGACSAPVHARALNSTDLRIRQSIRPTGGDPWLQMGRTLATDGHHLAVGIPHASIPYLYSGVIQMYRATTDGLDFQGLAAAQSDSESIDGSEFFGESVVFSGGELIATNRAGFYGVASLTIARPSRTEDATETTWQVVQNIPIPEENGAGFGLPMAANDDIALVASRVFGPRGADSILRVLRRGGSGDWALGEAIDLESTIGPLLRIDSITMDDRVAVIGVRTAAEPSEGRLVILAPDSDQPDAAWSAVGAIPSPVNDRRGRFGAALALGDEWMLAGFDRRTSAPWIFRREGTEFVPIGPLPAPELAPIVWRRDSAERGSGLAITGDLAVMLEPRGPEGTGTGSCLVFRLHPGGVTLLDSIPTNDPGDRSRATSVVVVGDTAVIGPVTGPDGAHGAGGVRLLDMTPYRVTRRR